MKKIFIGADHGGFQLKEQLKTHFKKNNIYYEDVGFHELDSADDFPDMALAVAERVAANNTRGILICSTGVGMCIAANKVKGIRAVVLDREQDVYLARKHNNINILCLAAFGFGDISAQIGDGSYKTLLDIKKIPTDPEHAAKLVGMFLSTDYEDKERFNRRLGKIASYEHQ